MMRAVEWTNLVFITSTYLEGARPAPLGPFRTQPGREARARQTCARCALRGLFFEINVIPDDPSS